MGNHLSQIDERLRQLEDAIGRLAARVTALEEPGLDRRDLTPPIMRAAIAPAADARAYRTDLELPILTLVGRTFLVFGGAYLLRALTESGQLTPASGIVVGLTYASAWMGAADRAAVRRPASGLFHGLASLVIACPLLLEASTRFGVLAPASAAALLVLVTALALGVAWHRELQSLAIMATVAGSITAIVLAVSTGQVWPFALSALVVGGAAEIVGAHRDWRWPARAPALAATLLTLDLVARALADAPLEPRLPALLAALLLAGVYVASMIALLLSERDEPPLADLILAGGAVLAGLGGGLSLARALGSTAQTSLGWTLILLGLVGYAIAWSRRLAWPAYTSSVLTTLSAMLLVIGVVTGLGWTIAVVALIAGGLVLQAIGTLTDYPWFVRQGAIFLVVAGAVSGLVMFAIDAWTAGPPGTGAPRLALLAAIAAGAGGVVAALLREDPTPSGRAATAALGALAAVGLGAFAVAWLGDVDGQPSTPGVVAAERSLVASVLIMVLMGFARVPALSSFRWPAYALIAGIAVKLVVEDFRVSSPISLFVTLGAFGAALIVTAKLRGGAAATTDLS